MTAGDLMFVEPFAPPDVSEARSGPLAAFIVGGWAMTGAVLGTLVGATLQLVGVLPSVVPLTLAVALFAGFLGAVAWGVDRRLAEGRTPVLDGRGRRRVPAGVWLLGLPLAALVPSLIGLVVIASVRAESIVPGLLFLLVAGGMALLVRPLVATHRLTRAITAAELGRDDDARERLERIHASVWTPRSGRAQAALNLGLLCLQAGELDDAARWYARPRRGRARAFAQTGLALVHALQGQLDASEEALAQAMATGAGRAIQGEVDAVRLLVVLRREGPAAARPLGEQLVGPGAGALFLGLLAVSRAATGSAGAAAEILTPEVRAHLQGTSFARSIPELEQMLAS